MTAPQAMLLSNLECPIQPALKILPEATREWFEETAEEEGTRFPATRDGLIAFLLLEVLPYFRTTLDGYKAGPAIRTQAWGESLDPDRMDRLMTLEERLNRQFEKAMAQLVAARKRRGGGGKSGAPLG